MLVEDFLSHFSNQSFFPHFFWMALVFMVRSQPVPFNWSDPPRSAADCPDGNCLQPPEPPTCTQPTWVCSTHPTRAWGRFPSNIPSESLGEASVRTPRKLLGHLSCRVTLSTTRRKIIFRLYAGEGSFRSLPPSHDHTDYRALYIAVHDQLPFLACLSLSPQETASNPSGSH